MAEEPSEAELREQLDAALRQLTVSDLLVQSVSTIASLGLRRLSREERDLPQARLAIDAVRALLPVLESGGVPGEIVRELRSLVASMQLRYAEAATE